MAEWGNRLGMTGGAGEGDVLRELARPVLQRNFEITRDKVPALRDVEEWTLIEGPVLPAIDWRTKEEIPGQFDYSFAWYVEVTDA